jgi:oligopeptide transport system substrate-binding protein
MLGKGNLPFLFLVMIVLASCKSTTHQDKTVFNFNLDAGITSLDPAFARNQNNIWAVHQLFNGLVELDDSLHVQPCIAHSWDISADLKTYTFHLRKDVFFHPSPLFGKDSTQRKVTAQDFVYSFERIISPTTASSGAWIFNDKIDTSQAFKALNDSTFQIKLRKPFPALLGLLSTMYCVVVPKEVVEHYGKDFRNHPIGTGPFQFNYWVEGEVLAMLKHESYFEKEENGKPLPYLDGIKISFIADKQTAFLEFSKGKLDFFSGIDGAYRNDLLNKNGTLRDKYKDKFKLVSGPYLNTEYLGMVCNDSLEIVKNSPLKDVKIRQAINFAINRENLVKYILNGIGTPGNQGFIPKGMPGFNPDLQGYAYYPEKAKALIKEAGYGPENPLPEIQLYTSTSYKDIIEFVQGELQKVGIPCKIEVQQSASLRELLGKNKINFFRGSWIADYPDAENYLAVFYSKNFIPQGPNYTRYKNLNFDKGFEQSFYAFEDAKRYKLYQALDQMVMKDAPVVILFYDKIIRLQQNNIEGLPINPINLLDLKRARKGN